MNCPSGSRQGLGGLPVRYHSPGTALRQSFYTDPDLLTIGNGMADEQDGLHLEVLDMRAHVWGVEQDLQKVVKTGKPIS